MRGLEEVSPVWLALQIQRSDIAFLCGAGTSVPSGLPTAAAFVRQFIYALEEAASCKLPQETVDKLSMHRLEHILQIAQQTPAFALDDCLACLQNARPNFVHSAIMRCISRYGRRPGVVLTTNFDSLFEDSASQMNPRVPVTVAGLSDLGDIGHHDNLVVKLHGDLSDDSARSIRSVVATLDLFSRRFTQEEEQTLDKLLRDRTLIVLGYSGSDHYDVMPYLSRHPSDSLIWLQHDSGLSDLLISKAESPGRLRYFFSRRNDVYALAHTERLLRAVQEFLGDAPLQESPTLAGREWHTRLEEYVEQRGPHRLLVLGDLLLDSGEFELAIENYKTALVTLPDDDYRARAKANRNIGTAYVLLERPNDAAGVLFSALESIRNLPNRDWAEESGILLGLGMAYKKAIPINPDYAAAAVAYTMESAEAGEAAGAPEKTALADANLGIMMMEFALNGEAEFEPALYTAVGALERAVRYFADNNLFYRMLLNGQRLADCYVALQQFDRAAFLYRRLAWLRRGIDYLDAGEEYRKTLGMVAATSGFASVMGISILDVLSWQWFASLGIEPSIAAELLKEARTVKREAIDPAGPETPTGWALVQYIYAKGEEFARRTTT